MPSTTRVGSKPSRERKGVPLKPTLKLATIFTISTIKPTAKYTIRPAIKRIT